MYCCLKLIIVVINGLCVGIGLIFMLYVDLRFVNQEVKFIIVFVQCGLIVEYGIVWLLFCFVGEVYVFDLLFIVCVFKGVEVECVGLVNWVLFVNEFVLYVMEIVKYLVIQVFLCLLVIMKCQICESYFQSFVLLFDIVNYEMEQSFMSFDFKEGVDSFVVKCVFVF